MITRYLFWFQTTCQLQGRIKEKEWCQWRIIQHLSVSEFGKGYLQSVLLDFPLCSIGHELLLLFSCSIMSDSLWLHGLQHTRLACLSLTPGACSNSCPLSQWCHPTILSSFVPFTSSLQSFPASGSFPVSWLFASDGQSIGSLASASVFPTNIQD